MGIQVSRILHAGYIFECEGASILFDPIFENPFSENAQAFPNAQFEFEKIKKLQFDAIFISHFHDDHCSFESLDLMDRKTPIYLYCLFEEMFSLLKELGFTNVFSLKIDDPVKIKSFEIIPRRALDADVDSIFQIKAAGLNILNVVDSWIDLETLEKLCDEKPWDLILWPFQTMREVEVLSPSRVQPASEDIPPEWISQLQALNPSHIVPSSCQFTLESWSWYNQAFFPITYAQFEKQISEILPQTKVVRMNPSVSILLEKNSFKWAPGLDWVEPLGAQNVDYQYDPKLKPPPTSLIAKNFKALTPEQVKRVNDYCQKELMQKYQSLESSEADYFAKPRSWKLCLYDHTGDVQNFYYDLSSSGSSLTVDHQNELGWLTEIPLAKLYAALECGEALTSLYIRINDALFTETIETEMAQADPLEDPLVRCLFNGAFAEYQKAQLKRLKAVVVRPFQG